MSQNITFEEMGTILDELIDDLPREIFNGLNGGVLLSKEIHYHPESVGKNLIVLGNYQKSILGHSINIFYGSIMEMYGFLDADGIREKVKETLYHELTHHLETMAGDVSLAVEDAEYIEKFRKRGE